MNLTPIQEFPIGKKTYPLHINNTAFKLTLNNTYHTALSIIDSIYKNTEIMLGNYSLRSTQHDLLSYLINLTGSSTYPIYKLNYEYDLTHLVNTLNPYLQTSTVHKADLYQSTIRANFNTHNQENISLPIFNGMHIQYDEVRHGLVIHNMPYEGELVKSKNFTQINKAISEKLKSIKKELELTGILKDSYLEVPTECKWVTTTTRSNNLVKLIDKLLTEDPNMTLDEKLIVAHALGQCSVKYGYELNLSSIASGSKHIKYFMFKDKVGYKWPPGAKKQVYFKYGAYELPEDYLEWFDKE